MVALVECSLDVLALDYLSSGNKKGRLSDLLSFVSWLR